MDSGKAQPLVHAREGTQLLALDDGVLEGEEGCLFGAVNNLDIKQPRRIQG